MLNDQDFAYVYVTFDEAYSNAGRAVAMAWSKARVLAEPNMITDMAKISRVEGTATKIHKVDELKKTPLAKRKLTTAASLRKPGEDADWGDEEATKMRFTNPLVQLMMDCKVGSAGDCFSRARSLVEATGIPTLHKAAITAEELRKYFKGRIVQIEMDKVESKVLEEFMWQSHSRVRAGEAIVWMSSSLQLGWSISALAAALGIKPTQRLSAPIEPNYNQYSWLTSTDAEESWLTGAERKQALAAEPGMIRRVEDAMETGAVKDSPTWLALLVIWLQSLTGLRLGHILRRSFPVERFEG